MLHEKFHSLSDTVSLDGDHWAKQWGLWRKTKAFIHFFNIKPSFLLPGFDPGLMFSRQMVVLYSEFNSVSNNISFEGDHRGKKIRPS